MNPAGNSAILRHRHTFSSQNRLAPPPDALHRFPFMGPAPVSCPHGEPGGVNHFVYPYECDIPCESCIHRLDCIKHTGDMMKSHIDNLTKKAVDELEARS